MAQALIEKFEQETTEFAAKKAEQAAAVAALEAAKKAAEKDKPADKSSDKKDKDTTKEHDEKKLKATAEAVHKAPVDTTIAEFYPEVEIFLSLLVLVWKMDTKQLPAAKSLADSLVKRLGTFNRRTLDSLSAKVFFYYARVYELLGAKEYAEVRPQLFALYRTAVLRHNCEGQVSLLNLLLRNFLEFNLYDQASHLVSNVEFSEANASSNEIARYYYYQGRILSVDPAKYDEAYQYLQQALRKAPSQGAKGFRVAVLKLSVIVQLLMGDIPERPLFRQRGVIVPLAPYMQLTQAVRFGDLVAFKRCIEEHADTFTRDKTLTLIQRLRHNVIKTGLRKINLSYSKISLADIAAKLLLDSEEDAEFIVAKAIKEKTIDATINHTERYVASNETIDVYSTKEPQEQFHLRTDFFIKIHNDAMKGMRYIPDAGRKKEHDGFKQSLKEEEDLAAALAEGDDFEDLF